MGLLSFQSYSQDKFNRLIIAPYVSEQVEGIDASVKSILENKLSQIVLENGLSAYAGTQQRFIITPKISVINKDVVSGAPIKISYNLSIAISVGDGLTGTKYGQTTLEVKGVGNSETKAYISAIKNIQPKQKDLQDLMSKSKQQILAFYDKGCDEILQQAKMYEGQEQFDLAVATLMTVPETSSCHNKATDQANTIYQKKKDYDCSVLLTKAKSAWVSSQDEQGAREASSYLGKISPSSKCADEINSLIETINTQMKAENEKTWKLIEKREDNKSELLNDNIKFLKEVTITSLENPQPAGINFYKIEGW